MRFSGCLQLLRIWDSLDLDTHSSAVCLEMKCKKTKYMQSEDVAEDRLEGQSDEIE